MTHKVKYTIILLAICIASVSSVFRVVSLQPISSNLQPAKIIRDAQILWSEMVNFSGGLLLNDTRHLVDLIILDVGANTSQQMLKNVINANKEINDGKYGPVHAIMAPYTSYLTEGHAIESEKYKMLSCTPSGGANTVFECDDNQLTPCTSTTGRRFEYLFGTQHSIATVFAPALALLRVKGARKVALFRETGANELYYSSARMGVIEATQNLKLDLVADLTVPFVDTLDARALNDMKTIISQIQQAKPDVVVGAVLEAACHAFVRAAKLMNYTAGEFVLAVCVSNSRSFKEVLGNDGRFVMGPV